MQQQHTAPNTFHLTVYYTDVNQVAEVSPNLRLFSPDERRILVGLGLHERSHQTNSNFLDALYALYERDFPDEWYTTASGATKASSPAIIAIGHASSPRTRLFDILPPWRMFLMEPSLRDAMALRIIARLWVR